MPSVRSQMALALASGHQPRNEGEEDLFLRAKCLMGMEELEGEIRRAAAARIAGLIETRVAKAKGAEREAVELRLRASARLRSLKARWFSLPFGCRL